MPPTPWYRHPTRFSLRTLLVVTTLVCCYLAWQGMIVRQRKAALDDPGAHAIAYVTTADEWVARYRGKPPQPPATLPLVRRWLGDVAIQEIAYSPVGEGKGSSHHKLSRLFPEARLTEPLYEPCHPGCFPLGTTIETLEGPRPIETVAVGDELVSFDARGASTTATVSSIFTTENRLWQITTNVGTLVSTEAQPLYVELGEARPVGELALGDTLYVYRDGQLQRAKVLAIAETDRAEPVINLVLGESRPFVAQGFLARSKPPAECDCPPQ
jgi:hypothetical protein